MMRRRYARRILIILLAFIGLASWVPENSSPAFAQDVGLDGISGRVVGPGNHSVGLIEVRLHLAATRNVLQITTASPGGEFQFRNVGDGDYFVTVDSDNYEHAEVAFTVYLGKTNTLTLELVPKRIGPRTGPQDVKASSPTVSVNDLTAKFPKKAIKEYLRGNDAMQRKDPAAAIEHYKKAVAIAPEMYAAINNLGIACTLTHRYPEAEAAFQKALSVDPSSTDAYVNLGHVYFEMEKYDQAEDLLARGLKRDPRSALAYYFLGMTQLRAGKSSEGETNLEKATELNDPAAAVAHLELANLYIKTHRASRAREHLEAFLKLKPNDPRVEHIRQVLARLEAGSVR